MISDVVQTAFITINEEGSEAAAATVMWASELCYRRRSQFTCDKPFMFRVCLGLTFFNSYACGFDSRLVLGFFTPVLSFPTL